MLEIFEKIVIIARMRALVISLAILSILGIIPQQVQAEGLSTIQLEMRDYDEITLPAGTFIPVINLQEISTKKLLFP